MHKCIFRLNFSYPVAEHYQPWAVGVGRGKRGNKNKKSHVCCPAIQYLLCPEGETFSLHSRKCTTRSGEYCMYLKATTHTEMFLHLLINGNYLYTIFHK